MKLIQGNSNVFFLFVIFIIVFGFMYSILMRPMGVVYDSTYDDPILQQDQVYQDFFIRVKAIWYWFPLIGAIVMVLWGINKMRQYGEIQQ